MFQAEKQQAPIKSNPWKKESMPRRVLAIRMHAMGDVIITLPYLQHLRNHLPASTQLDFLTIAESKSIPKNIYLFDKVYSIKGGRRLRKQFIYAILLLPQLLLRRYDVVIDLQNRIISRMIRKFLMPQAWSEFDRFSPIPAGDRTRLTIEAACIIKNSAETSFRLKNTLGVDELLKQNGWDSKHNIAILNPAGAFETRNWPLKNYVEFARLWTHRFPATQFLIMGIGSSAAKADYLKNELGTNLINLVNKTTAAQAFAIVQKAKFVLSEDSGLMHIAWVSGIPVLALFGSSRSDWSRPLGKHSDLLGSSDLECGNCMLEFCKYGDTHCLTRYSAEMVFEKSMQLLKLAFPE